MSSRGSAAGQPVEVPPWENGEFLKEEEFTRAVALGLFDYLRKSRSHGFVVSLSGGADSAAVACLSALLVHFGVAELGRAPFPGKAGARPGAVVRRCRCAAGAAAVDVCVSGHSQQFGSDTRPRHGRSPSRSEPSTWNSMWIPSCSNTCRSYPRVGTRTVLGDG